LRSLLLRFRLLLLLLRSCLLLPGGLLAGSAALGFTLLAVLIYRLNEYGLLALLLDDLLLLLLSHHVLLALSLPLRFALLARLLLDSRLLISILLLLLRGGSLLAFGLPLSLTLLASFKIINPAVRRVRLSDSLLLFDLPLSFGLADLPCVLLLLERGPLLTLKLPLSFFLLARLIDYHSLLLLRLRL
jgi:hypothetical protein